MTDTEKPNRSPQAVWASGWKLVIIISAVVLVIYGCAGFVLVYRFVNDPKQTAEFGQFGDSFGVVNALFSALAFAAVVSSLYLQGKEFSTSIEELIQSNKNQRKSNLLNAIEALNQINQCAAFDPFRILYRPSERTVALQLFSSKLLVASLIEEVANVTEGFPSVNDLRLARDNSNRLFGQADILVKETEELRFHDKSEPLVEHDEKFQQITTNVLDCIVNERQKELIDLRIQYLALLRRQTSERLQKPHSGQTYSTNDHSVLMRELSTQYTAVACDITKLAMHNLGFPCEYTRDLDDWLKENQPFK